MLFLKYYLHVQDQEYIMHVLSSKIVDDIQEAYRRLRRLVTDYLGISLVSEQSDSADEEETLLVTEGQQTQMGTRTWSKPSIPDSLSQPYTRGKTSSPVQSGRGILVGFHIITVLCKKDKHLSVY